MRRKGQEGVPDGYKRCSKCGEVKLAGEFYKGSAQCKPCFSIKGKEYREKNLDKIREQKHAYYQRNRDKKLQHDRKYYSENKERFVKYRQENRENIKKRMDVWREKNSDKIREWRREYNQKNADKINEYNKKNIEHIKKYRKEYRIKNREREREYQRIHNQLPEVKTIHKINKARQRHGAKIYLRDIDESTFQAIHAVCVIDREIRSIKKASLTEEEKNKIQKEHIYQKRYREKKKALKKGTKPLDNPVHSDDNVDNSIGGN